MISELQYKWALDEEDILVHIKDAEKQKSYSCPGCKTRFTLRKSGKTGPGSRRAHFAHAPDSKCSGESYLHNAFKKSLVKLLERYQSDNKALIVNWVCNACSEDYSKANLSFNLLAKTDKIEEEYYLDGFRPDIALLDKLGKTIAAIEIVYTHEPEEDLLQYYEKNGITMIQINLFFEEDLDRVEEKIIHPDIVNFCLNSKCPNFKNHEIGRKLIISDVNCKRGPHSFLACHVEVTSVFETIKTTAITENEINEAVSKGVYIRTQINKSTNKKFNIISCPHCENTKVKVRLRVNTPRRRNFPNRPFD